MFFKGKVGLGRRHSSGKRWAQRNDRAWEKMCPQGWIMAGENVGFKRKWVGEKICPWGENGAREKMWLEDEDGFEDGSLGKRWGQGKDGPRDGSLGRR